MSWKQVKAFSIYKMGTTKNFCLRNVRQGYGIAGKYANARQAMYENRDKGTLHPLNTIPSNVSVPVFSAAGLWGHVIVCDHGVYYSDGKRIGKPNNSYQWGELLNGVRVVEYVKTPQPTPVQPSTIKVGDTVIVTGAGTATSTGTGAKTKSYAGRKMKVISIVNNHYGCNQYNQNGAITGWWAANQVKKA